MERFEYAHPSTKQEAIGLLGSNWNDAAVLAGGTDLLSLMKEYVVTPKRIVNIKNVEGLNGIHSTAEGVTIGALATWMNFWKTRPFAPNFLPSHTPRRASPVLRFAPWVRSAEIFASARVAGISATVTVCWRKMKTESHSFPKARIATTRFLATAGQRIL